MMTALILALMSGQPEAQQAVGNAHAAKVETDSYRATVAGYLAGEKVHRAATQVRFDAWKAGKPMVVVLGVSGKIGSGQAQLNLGDLRLGEGDEMRITANTQLVLAEAYLAAGQWGTAEVAGNGATVQFGAAYGKYNAVEGAACSASTFFSEANSMMDAW